MTITQLKILLVLSKDISSIEEQINNIKNSIKEEEKELQKRINYCVANFEEIEQRMELIKEKSEKLKSYYVCIFNIMKNLKSLFQT